eukprot:CAMPEP_0177783542 /NCGR_PEP_ID=MMETSP0491_2-20121128/19170_1 /TAXON_ID=63592 /ORGANISM="Tetraselmis chuii, Strain PLY429" /LENGTH=81 /DNA_ID=CAMNT_0019304143 /DNA_START=232 /DNA_END=474 /DNA_ORIENTATION=+
MMSAQAVNQLKGDISWAAGLMISESSAKASLGTMERFIMVSHSLSVVQHAVPRAKQRQRTAIAGVPFLQSLGQLEPDGLVE